MPPEPQPLIVRVLIGSYIYGGFALIAWYVALRPAWRDWRRCRGR